MPLPVCGDSRDPQISTSRSQWRWWVSKTRPAYDLPPSMHMLFHCFYKVTLILLRLFDTKKRRILRGALIVARNRIQESLACHGMPRELAAAQLDRLSSWTM